MSYVNGKEDNVGKVTIIIESKEQNTAELERLCHKLFSSNSAEFFLPDDRQVYIVPADDSKEDCDSDGITR